MQHNLPDRRSSVSRAPQSSSAGFTLLELLAVIGVISVLLGIGGGYLGKTDPAMIAGSILAGERRAAQMTARAEGVPTEVIVSPGREAEPATVQAHLLQPAIVFHFEPQTPVLDERMRPTLGGDDVVAGRFGHARRSMPGDKNSLVQWAVAEEVVDARDGFVIRVDLYLERRESCVVIDMAPLLEVRLDQNLRPDVRMSMTLVGGEKVRKNLQSQQSLPLERWVTLEVGADGSALWLAVDNREFARTAAVGSPEQTPEMMLEVSPPSSPVPGLVDEFRIMVFEYAAPQLLPMELQPSRIFRFTYDKRGEPVDAPKITWESLDSDS
jgi:prepilin-type N-terminal cleavage/methylation domain-containing protein